MDFTNVEGWADTQARGIPRLEPPLAALLCPGAGWRPNDRLQKQIVGLTDRVFVCASQSAAAVNNIAMLSSAMVSLSADREAYGPEEAARWLAVSRFSSAILQLCQPIAVSAGRHMAWATMIQRIIWLSHTAVPQRERASLVQGPLAPDGLFGPRFSEVLAHQQSVRENRSRFGGTASDSSPGAAAAAAAAAATADEWSSATDREPGDCRVAVGRRVHMPSGSPASKKRRSLEPRGLIRDSLHKPVDAAACTGPLVPHIIAVGSPSLQPLCVLARAVRSAIVVGHHVEMGPSHTVQASSPTLYGVGGDHATGPGCEHGSGSRGGTSLDSSGGLLANGWTPRRHKLRVLPVPRSVSPDLEYWKGPSALLKGVPLGRVASYVVVFTDASMMALEKQFYAVPKF
ncbi:unnamed protein product [Boreogadus saida]